MCQEMMRAEIWLQESLSSQGGIEELAVRMGYSTSQIRRRFRHCFGISPGVYRDRLRLEKAARLLIHTPEGISQIARLCGYCNHSAFSRAFHRRYGQTPRRYRQSMRLRLNRQRRGIPAFPFRVTELPARQAVLTRLYDPPGELEDLTGWRSHAQGAEVLPPQLGEAPPLAIFHDQPLESSLPRLDLGVQLPDEPLNLALPPTFRLMRLPAQRHACLRLEHSRELRSAMLFMTCRGITGEGETLSGDPPHLVQEDSELELRIPLL
ncbi:helix-turn-helix transcriptional regulator [Halomonas beimenensis]|uniref:DNA gyrase inhibitor GyrI n=1 Tax=Halomonas beimenensis TaxID=475662 RepID=A0A291P6V4_9GAMM|nr:AraC family transcriptional regulator [Halomonas beimenensis]ATJ82610.1 DNA gyrase inhibitor GyrI [Halomonas beimenensis]